MKGNLRDRLQLLVFAIGFVILGSVVDFHYTSNPNIFEMTGIFLLSMSYSWPMLFFIPKKIQYEKPELATSLFITTWILSGVVLFLLYIFNVIPLILTGDAAKFSAEIAGRWHNNDWESGYWIFMTLVVSLFDFVVITTLFHWFKVKKLRPEESAKLYGKVLCPKCQHENSAKSEFCGKCGAKLKDEAQQ